MATVDAYGITPKGLDEYIVEIRQSLKESFGQDFSVSSETPQGQIVGILALAMTEIDESLVALSNGNSPSFASGIQLDHLGGLLGFKRPISRKSTAQVSLTGQFGVTVPEGIRFSNSNNNTFLLDEAVTLDDSGLGIGNVTASDFGNIPVTEGSITKIRTLVAGLESVTNSEGLPGQEQDNDNTYRAKLLATTGRLANGHIDALKGGFYEAGVRLLRIDENSSNEQKTSQSVNIRPHSVLCILDNTLNDTEAARIIQQNKGLGVDTSGDIEIVVAGNTIRFSRVEKIPIKVSVDVSISGSSSAKISDIKSNLAAYAAGNWRARQNQFETSGFQIGESIDNLRLQTPIHSVKGFSLTSMEVTDAEGAELPEKPTLIQVYTLPLENITVTIS